MLKRIFSACFLAVLILTLPIFARASEEPTDAYVRKLLQYYQHYQTQAQPEIEHYLALMDKENPAQAAKWRKIMELWTWADTQMPVSESVLPDGLPQDDSMCIVVLGYGLTPNGAMKPELMDRLEVAQASAEKYPDAWILLTGGETSHVRGVSEAGEMRTWLVARGVEESRILVDTEALSTTENAQNTCRILKQQYPQVTTLTVVTSDYHCRWGASLLSVAAWLSHGENLRVAGGACNRTDNIGYNSYSAQARGIALLTGIQLRGEAVPELYIPRETEPVAAVAEEQPEELVCEELPQRNGMFIWIALLAVAIGIYLMARRNENGSASEI